MKYTTLLCATVIAVFALTFGCVANGVMNNTPEKEPNVGFDMYTYDGTTLTIYWEEALDTAYMDGRAQAKRVVFTDGTYVTQNMKNFRHVEEIVLSNARVESNVTFYSEASSTRLIINDGAYIPDETDFNCKNLVIDIRGTPEHIPDWMKQQ